MRVHFFIERFVRSFLFGLLCGGAVAVLLGAAAVILISPLFGN